MALAYIDGILGLDFFKRVKKELVINFSQKTLELKDIS
jgi:hypothetical protein